jgi:hypothetical protein
LLAIPLAASALAVGISSNTTASRNFLIGASAGGATALGVGSFLIDRRRDLIYYNGAKNIYCLHVAIAPLAILQSEFEQMRDDVERLRLVDRI